MTQSEPLTLVTAQTAEQPEISPAVAEIMARAHEGAMIELGRFAADETNPFLYYLRKTNKTIGSILGQDVNPKDFSEIISLKKRFRDQEAANEERFRNAA